MPTVTLLVVGHPVTLSTCRATEMTEEMSFDPGCRAPSDRPRLTQGQAGHQIWSLVDITVAMT